MYVPVFAVGKILQYDSVALAQVTVTRRHENYMYRTGAVAGVLPLIALFSHSVENLGDKLGINITLLLTLATVLFSQGDALPKVPYLTYVALRMHALSCCTACFAMLHSILHALSCCTTYFVMLHEQQARSH
jgi:hypothetical protein